MKSIPLLCLAACTLLSTSCQNARWPWKKADAYADPYAAGNTQAQGYPGAAQPYNPAGGQNYTQPTYNPAGEQGQVYQAPGGNPPGGGFANEPQWQSPPTSSPPPAYNGGGGGGGGGNYTVRRGDTLMAIGRKHNVSVSSLMRANGLNSSLIRVGQRLRIP